MLKKCALALLLLAAVVSALVLGKTAMEEVGSRHRRNYEKVSITGTYEAGGVARGLCEEFYGVEGHGEVVIKGRFVRAIEKNIALHMRVDDMRVRLFINGALAFDSEGAAAKDALFTDTTWVTFVSPGICVKDDIRFELTCFNPANAAESLRLFTGNLYVDAGGSYLLDVLRASLPNTFFSAFVMCLGVVFLTAALVLRFSKKLAAAALLIGVLSIFSGLLFLIDFGAISLYLPLGAFWNGVGVVSLAVVEVCIMLYLWMHLTTKLKNLLLLVAGGDVLLLLAGGVLKLAGVTDYSGLYPVKFVLLNAGICAMLANIIHEIVIEKKSISGSLLPVFILGIGAVGDVILYVAGVNHHTLPFRLSVVAFLTVQAVVLSRSVRSMVEESARAEVLRKLAYRDSLTGVRNRTSYLEFIAGVNLELKDGAVYGAAMFDLNRLKQANDEHGHQFGDELIRHCAKVICQALKNNPVFRIGGDEFVAVLYEKDKAMAKYIPQRLMDAEKTLRVENPQLPEISVACGVAFFDPKIDLCFEDVIARADELMYQDKSAGHLQNT